MTRQRIVSTRRPPPLHLQKLIQENKPRVPPSELPRAGQKAIGFFPASTSVSVEHGNRNFHIPYSPVHGAAQPAKNSIKYIEERESSPTKKLAVSFDAPAWTQIDNVRILTPSHPVKHRLIPASCKPIGVSVISNLPLYYESKDMLPNDALHTSPISPRTKVISALNVPGMSTPPGSPLTPRSSESSRSARTPLVSNGSSGVAPLLKGQSQVKRKSPNRKNRRMFFPPSPKSARQVGSRRQQHLELSADEKRLVKLGYTIEALRPAEKHILGPLLRDDQHPMIYRALNGPDDAPQHERYSHRCERRHVGDNHGRKKVRPSYEKQRYGANIIMGHSGEGKTGNSLKECGIYTDTASISSRGHRKQYPGGSSGGRSSIGVWNGRLG